MLSEKCTRNLSGQPWGALRLGLIPIKRLHKKSREWEVSMFFSGQTTNEGELWYLRIPLREQVAGKGCKEMNRRKELQGRTAEKGFKETSRREERLRKATGKSGREGPQERVAGKRRGTEDGGERMASEKWSMKHDGERNAQWKWLVKDGR